MKLLAVFIGLIIGAIGIVAFAVPTLLLESVRSMLTPTTLYIIAAMRVGIGVLLFLAAPVSRLPAVLRVLGILIAIAGVVTPFFGVERSLAVLDWASSQGPVVIRAGAGVAIAFGLFIVYAFTSLRRTAD